MLILEATKFAARKVGEKENLSLEFGIYAHVSAATVKTGRNNKISEPQRPNHHHHHINPICFV